MKEKLLIIFIFRILPTTLLSRIFGFLTRIKFPQFILSPSINKFIKAFNINESEFVVPDGGFKTFDAFFTRELLAGVHKIDNNPMSVVSPDDGRLDQFGKIDMGTVVQAKGVDFTLDKLIPTEMAANFINGTFATIYLSPADYHRIHSPVNGKVENVLHVPGRLFTVQEFMVKGYAGLFSVNERLITFIDTPFGKVAVCKIGAMNVGRISSSFSTDVTNTHPFRRIKDTTFINEFRPEVEKGEEVGVFHLGSTVVLLFESGMMDFNANLKKGQRVRIGESIGMIKSGGKR